MFYTSRGGGGGGGEERHFNISALRGRNHRSLASRSTVKGKINAGIIISSWYARCNWSILAGRNHPARPTKIIFFVVAELLRDVTRYGTNLELR